MVHAHRVWIKASMLWIERGQREQCCGYPSSGSIDRAHHLHQPHPQLGIRKNFLHRRKGAENVRIDR